MPEAGRALLGGRLAAKGGQLSPCRREPPPMQIIPPGRSDSFSPAYSICSTTLATISSALATTRLANVGEFHSVDVERMRLIPFAIALPEVSFISSAFTSSTFSEGYVAGYVSSAERNCGEIA